MEEKVPLFWRSIPDRNYEIIYHVFSYKEISDNNSAWIYVAKFLGLRRRKNVATQMYLPLEVKLEVQKDGSVKSRHLLLQPREARKRNFPLSRREFLEFRHP